MTDEELLMYQLRNPSVMALDKDHLYSMMHEHMALAADRIEQLLKKNEALERSWKLYMKGWGVCMTDEEFKDLREELSALSSYLGAGMGDDNTTIPDYIKRIKWGIEYNENAMMNIVKDLRFRVAELEKTE